MRFYVTIILGDCKKDFCNTVPHLVFDKEPDE